MPTGYTSNIEKGISFNEFIMNCARGFGACLSLRDEPASTEIPEEFKPSTYHVDKLDNIEKRIVEVKQMTLPDVEAEALNQYQADLKRKGEGIRKSIALKSKYLQMLTFVEQWEPPTSNHTQLKTFMKEQIKGSIGFDCKTDYYNQMEIVYLLGEEWRSKELSKLLEDLEYHTRHNIEEIGRASKNTLWVTQLRESLCKSQ